MEYLQWNDLIARNFFNEDMSGREVLIYVNESSFAKLGRPHGANADDFIAAVKRGPPWATHQGFCQKALQACDGWRARSLTYPPYIAYLAFFVLAAGTQGDFAAHAYYPRFWKLLGEPDESRTPPSFDQMLDLWDDLEKWSKEDKREEWGRFVATIRGKWWKVGLPLSQTLLSEDERMQLPRIFDDAELDPMDPPSPELLPRILTSFGRKKLERRTLRLLETSEGDDSLLRNPLVELVHDELINWDGSLPVENASTGSPPLLVKTGLRICLEIDWMARSAKAYFRFKAGKPFPEDGLNFEQDGFAAWSCREISQGQGWSTKLADAQAIPSKVFDAATIDWTNGLQLFDSENNWRARFKGSSTKLFLPGSYEGLPDWVESNRLQRGSKFLVACTGAEQEKLLRWGKEHCDQLEEKALTGLPAGWILFLGSGPRASCQGIDVLTFSSALRLLLKGGIRSGTGRGNSYLRFAPPAILVENGDGKEKLTFNDRLLKCESTMPPTWHIPRDAPIGTPLHIKLDLDELSIRRVVRLEEPALPLSYSAPWRNSMGSFIREEGPAGARGAVVQHHVESQVAYPPALPTHLSDRIIFVGANPGEISDWPGDPLPSGWHPVWAIAKARREDWQAHFCGRPEQAKDGHKPGQPLSDAADRKRWRKAIWGRRKVTNPPGLDSLRAVWKHYLRTAENV